MFGPCDRRHVYSATVVSRKKHSRGMFVLVFFRCGFNFRHVLVSVAESSFKDETMH